MLRFCSQTSQDSAARFTTASCPSVLFCTLIGNQVEAEAGSTQDPPMSPAVISLIVPSCWTGRLSRSCLPSNVEFLIFPSSDSSCKTLRHRWIRVVAPSYCSKNFRGFEFGSYFRFLNRIQFCYIFLFNFHLKWFYYRLRLMFWLL